MIGQNLGHYIIEAKLGEGGMGVVYRARDTRLGRSVAIKVLPGERVSDAERKRRFVQEAKAASALNHPNIVHIYGIDTEDGVDFIAMEYVEGKTLDEVIGRQGLKTAETLHYAAQIADALATAHAAGIVHRDIKPSNIMVSAKGLVKVLDFGLAKLAEHAEIDPAAPTQTMSLRTEEGTIIGTASYMSPEQAEGKKLDARSDIFSFGTVLYEMVTGHRAFPGENKVAILAAILHKEPKAIGEAARDPVPPELQTLIARCLRKDPQRRIQHLDDVKLELEELKQASASGTRPHAQATAPASRRRVVLGAFSGTLLLAAVLFAWRTWRVPQSSEPLRAVPLSTQSGVHRYPSISPDGNLVAFSWNGPKQDNPDIYVQQIGAGSYVRRTTDPGNDYNPVWSSDGRWIAYLRSKSEAGNSEIRLMPPLGGTDHKLTEIRIRGGTWVTPPYMTWCPDSNCLVATDSPGEGKPAALVVISLETGLKIPLTDPQPPALADTSPAISPDGAWLVFRRTGNLFNGELYRLPLARGPASGLSAAGQPQRLTVATLDANHPTWMSDSKEILLSAGGGLRTLTVAGEKPWEIAPARLAFVGEDGLMPVVSRQQPGRPSRLVYVRSFFDANIWRLETSAPGAPASSLPAPLISSTRGEWFPQFSPDGRRLAFTSDRTGEGAVYLADPDGSNVVPLALMHAFATGAVHWSHDGQKIAFHSNPEGQGEIYVVAAAGGKPENFTKHPASDSFPSFSKDGKWIYFSSNRETQGGKYQIWKMPAAGGGAIPVPNAIGYVPVESPDGYYLYYIETFDKPSPLWRVPVSGGSPFKVLEGVFFANYMVLSRGIYYIDKPSGQGGVHFLDIPTGETRLQYFEFATNRSKTVARNLGQCGGLSASPDGRTILYSRTDSTIDDLMLVENFR